jgi:hypothetical protein
MQNFLESLADRLIENDSPLENQVVVLPTKRSSGFLVKILSDRIQETAWLPEIITINEWAAEIANMEAVEPLLASFSLYEAYLSSLGAEAQSMPEFLSWSSILLTDFNDIDGHLIDPKIIFKELVDYTEIEHFSFLNQPLSEKQEVYLKFWKKLPLIFDKFRADLLTKGMGTSGMIMAEAAKNAESYFDQWRNKHFTIAGFNAFTNAEKKLLQTMVDRKAGEVYFDADEYLLQENKNAGYFIKRYLNTGLGKVLPRQKPTPENAKEIHIVQAAHKLDQANAVAAILENVSPEDLENTAVVLADESMLQPIIERLPERIEKVNITMGLNVGKSLFGSWVDTWLSLLGTVRMAADELAMDNRQAEHFVNHPFSQLIHLSKGATNNSVPARDFLANHSEYSALIAPSGSGSASVLDQLRKRLEHLIQLIYRGDVKTPEIRMALLGAEKLIEVTDRLKALDTSGQLDLNPIKDIYARTLRSTTLSLLGEPGKGLQIMGVLEARAIGFENLILCSVDEGNFPKKNHFESFIPFDVRLFHGLPAKREREAVFAYQFYRLFSHAEKFTAVYHSDGGSMGGGERSRYLHQLTEDFDQSQVKELQTKNTVKAQRPETTALEKTEGVIKTIREFLVERGLSASSLNRYFDSPHEWYYSNVLKLREPKSFEIDAAIFGDIVHLAFENLYKPYVNQKLSVATYREMESKLRSTLEAAFREKSDQTHFETGVNRLHFETAKRMIEAFLKKEIAEVEAGADVVYIGSEEKVSRSFSLEVDGEKIEVKVKGYIDHIEKRNGVLHLIDFKTGKVEMNDLDLSSKKALSDEELREKLIKKPKALQLLLYDWLYEEKRKGGEMKHQIISLVAPGKRDLFLKISDRELALETFELVLKKTALEMLSANESLEVNEEYKYAIFS